ncbi:MAG: B12-binding domain-containing radical SAM protein, partial [Ruminiclostridium sp.]|nr:B12-binding domain-containing radical SAM protein [Ruminiclostridium sp.]
MRDIKKIIIIQAGKNMCDGFAKKFLYTNITCPSIAAAIPGNIDIEIIDMYVQNIDFGSINADLALITTLTTFAPIAFGVACELKKKGITVIVGGIHAVVMPDECQQHFDAIAIGEAELLIEEILSDFRSGNLKKRYETRELFDLTKCNVPRYDLLQLHKYSFIALMASKGCAFDCDFCSSRLVTGAGFRHKSVEQVLNEIRYIQKLHEKDPLIPDTFFFADSNLYTDRGFLRELLNALIPIDIRHWGLFASVNIADDDEILELLQKANCEIIQIGFESINPASLKNNNKKQNNPVKYKEVVEKLAAKGIYAYGSFIFGFDDDDRDVFKKTAEALEEANFIMTGFFTLTPFPGTKIYERLSKAGRILCRDWSKYNME